MANVILSSYGGIEKNRRIFHLNWNQSQLKLHSSRQLSANNGNFIVVVAADATSVPSAARVGDFDVGVVFNHERYQFDV